MEVVKANTTHLSLGESSLNFRVRLLEQALMSLDEAVLIKDLNAVVVFWNKGAEELYGFTAQEAIGRCVRELHAASLSEEAYAAMLTQLHSGVPKVSEVERKNKNGKTVHVRMQKAPLFDELGVLIGESTITRDVDDIRKLEEALNLVKETLKTKQEANADLKREINLRHQSEQAQSDLNQSLQATVHKLESLRKDTDQMTRLAELLQSCSEVTEGHAVIAAMVESMFPGTPGQLYIYRESRDSLEQVKAWGDTSRVPPEQAIYIGPQDCWALRLGHSHNSNGSLAIRCNHLKSSATCCACVSIYGDGQVLGLLSLELDATVETQKRLQALVSRIGPGLSNLKLRESLKSLALRDGLTGLYNRRFLDDALQRLLSIVDRSGDPFSLIMVDLDHFKRFNDDFGHEAGDFVLRSVAKAMTAIVRSTDMVCRFGGEELVILLPHTQADDALARAEQIRLAIRELNLVCAGQTLPTTTASFGVVESPRHGKKALDFLKAADTALYRAKAEGRDRVCLAP